MKKRRQSVRCETGVVTKNGIINSERVTFDSAVVDDIMNEMESDDSDEGFKNTFSKKYLQKILKAFINKIFLKTRSLKIS